MIEENIRGGMTGANETEYTAYLMELASSAVTSIRRGGSSPIQTAHRVLALRLLSYIGSRETVPFLVNISKQDPEPTVQAAAAEAIGRIGVDPDGLALTAFSMKIYSTAAQRNEQVLAAIAASTASLCRFSGPPLSGDGIKLLVLLANDNIPRIARNQATKELETLR
jgi:outer membrane protein assembly factor BamB